MDTGTHQWRQARTNELKHSPVNSDTHHWTQALTSKLIRLVHLLCWCSSMLQSFFLSCVNRYVALCYCKLDYYDVSMEILQVCLGIICKPVFWCMNSYQKDDGAQSPQWEQGYNGKSAPCLWWCSHCCWSSTWRCSCFSIRLLCSNCHLSFREGSLRPFQEACILIGYDTVELDWSNLVCPATWSKSERTSANWTVYQQKLTLCFINFLFFFP